MTLLTQGQLANALKNIGLQKSCYICESLPPLFTRVASDYLVTMENILANNRVSSGAVKSNVGHLEGTSAITGIIKAILAVEKGIIPPNTNFEKLNPQIDAEFFNLKVMCLYMRACSRADLYSFLWNLRNGHVGAYEELL